MPMTAEAKLANSTELPPRLAFFQMITGHYVSRAIYVAAKLGIADLLAGGPRHYDELATSAGAHAPSLNRLLRLLASVGVFAEAETGHFALTPIGEWLRTEIAGSSHAVALYEASGFKLTRILPVEGSLLSVLEGVRL